MTSARLGLCIQQNVETRFALSVPNLHPDMLMLSTGPDTLDSSTRDIRLTACVSTLFLSCLPGRLAGVDFVLHGLSIHCEKNYGYKHHGVLGRTTYRKGRVATTQAGANSSERCYPSSGTTSALSRPRAA